MDRRGRKEVVFVTNYRMTSRSTIALRKITKERLDASKPPGQCYDRFIRELVHYWQSQQFGSSLGDPGRLVQKHGEIEYHECVQSRTAIALNRPTKAKLEEGRVPGQSYDGLLKQLLGLWEETHGTGRVAKADIYQRPVTIRKNFK